MRYWIGCQVLVGGLSGPIRDHIVVHQLKANGSVFGGSSCKNGLYPDGDVGSWTDAELATRSLEPWL